MLSYRRQAATGCGMIMSILACHSDQALALLNRPTTAEDKLLSSIRYQNNRAVLHTDLNLMPDKPGGLGQLELYWLKG